MPKDVLNGIEQGQRGPIMLPVNAGRNARPRAKSSLWSTIIGRIIDHFRADYFADPLSFSVEFNASRICGGVQAVLRNTLRPTALIWTSINKTEIISEEGAVTLGVSS